MFIFLDPIRDLANQLQPGLGQSVDNIVPEEFIDQLLQQRRKILWSIFICMIKNVPLQYDNYAY